MNFLRQATAGQVRALGPFSDPTDLAPETGLTIANTDVKLMLDGGASANKNSGGGTHRVNGFYAFTFDDTDTATVGELTVSIVVAGALPVAKTFRVLEPAVYDALFADEAPGFATVAAMLAAQTEINKIPRTGSGSYTKTKTAETSSAITESIG